MEITERTAVDKTSTAIPVQGPLGESDGRPSSEDPVAANESARETALGWVRLAANSAERTEDRFTTSLPIDELYRFKINGVLREAGLGDVIFYHSSTLETERGPIVCVRATAVVHGMALDVKGFGANQQAAAYNAATILAENARSIPARENPPPPNKAIQLRTSIHLPDDVRRSLEQQLSATRLNGPVVLGITSRMPDYGIYSAEAVGTLADETPVSARGAGNDEIQAAADAIRRLVKEYPAP